MKKIPLSKNGKLGTRCFALVDDEDFEELSKHNWAVGDGYAIRSIRIAGKSYTLSMHRYLLPPPDGMFIDHINRNKLDNRRNNLRICTKSQNNTNREAPANNTSGYKGVSFHRRDKLWRARLFFKRKEIFVRYFKVKEDAARAYNEAAKKYYGEFAFINEI